MKRKEGKQRISKDTEGVRWHGKVVRRWNTPRFIANSRVIELLRFMRPLSGNGANLSLGLVTEVGLVEEEPSDPVFESASSDLVLLLAMDEVEA